MCSISSETNDHLDEGVYRDPFCGAACDLDLDAPVASHYDATNVAAFGEVRLGLTQRLDFTAGLRAERRDAHYDDTSAARFDPRDDMTGGELALSWRLAAGRSAYVRLARGYKAGGFNISLAGVDFGTIDNAEITPNEIQFGPEYLESVESGYRFTSANGRLSAEADVFYARRTDEQIKIPLQLRLGDPSSFLFVTANAERATLSGVEGKSRLARDRAARFLRRASGCSTRRSSASRCSPSSRAASKRTRRRTRSRSGRSIASPSGWFGARRRERHGRVLLRLRVRHQVEAVHADESESRPRLGQRWSASLWARNVFDTRYFVRGFYFGNEPPDFPNKLYTRLGDPRQYGFTLRYRF